MKKKLSKLQIAQKKRRDAANEANRKITEFNKHASALYTSITTILSLFDRIRNVPEEKMLEYEKLKDTLSDSVAKNAALMAGGGGMVTGSSIVSSSIASLIFSGAVAGPVGWAIVVITSVARFCEAKEYEERLENIYTLICDRDTKSYELAVVELSERIKSIIDEAEKLENAIAKIKTFGTDYSKMSEEQQYELGTYVNLMNTSTMLFVKPILGLQLKYSEQDFDKLCAVGVEKDKSYFKNHKAMVIFMANLLFKIPLDDKDKHLLAKSLKKNKEFLSSVQMTKKDFSADDILMVEKALNHKYKSSAY